MSGRRTGQHGPVVAHVRPCSEMGGSIATVANLGGHSAPRGRRWPPFDREAARPHVIDGRGHHLVSGPDLVAG